MRGASGQGGLYTYKVTAVVPDSYPMQSAELCGQESSLSAVLVRYFNGQSWEIACQCVAHQQGGTGQFPAGSELVPIL